MSSSITSLIQTRSSLPAVETPRMNVVSAVSFLIPLLFGGLATWATFNFAPLIIGIFLGLLLAQAPKVARQWERAVVLRLGRYVGLRWSRFVLDHSVRRHRFRVGGPARDYDQLRG